MPIKTVHVPTMGDSITEGTIVDIPVAPGDYVREDDVVVVLETDKVSVDVRASESGKVVEILGEVDDVVEVGSALYRLDTDVEAPDGGGGGGGSVALPSPPTAEATAPPVVAEAVAAAPVVVAASSPPTPTPPPALKKAAPSPPPLPAIDFITTSLGNRPERRSKMSRMR
jgi:2-oxoglutarate dehydrogenase E2 component (dihydrolipoamide succinyltransferase)